MSTFLISARLSAAVAVLLVVAGCGSTNSVSKPAPPPSASAPNPIPAEVLSGLSARLKTKKVDLSDPSAAKKAAFIEFWLGHTFEVHAHRMRGANANEVYLAPDGHSEAVYDAAGDLVRDPINQGSYNYAHPVEQPLAHFVADILPWLRWGNASNDPTSVKERTDAYLLDLQDGLHRALEEMGKGKAEPDSDLTEAEWATLAFYMDVIDDTSVSKLLAVPAKDRDAAVTSFMAKLQGNLNTALAEEIKAAPPTMDR